MTQEERRNYRNRHRFKYKFEQNCAHDDVAIKECMERLNKELEKFEQNHPEYIITTRIGGGFLWSDNHWHCNITIYFYEK